MISWEGAILERIFSARLSRNFERLSFAGHGAWFDEAFLLVPTFIGNRTIWRNEC